MSLKTYASMESWIDTNVNAGINDIPGVFLHACSGLLEIKGKASEIHYQVAQFEVVPVCGDYMCIAVQAWVASGSGELWFELEQAGLTSVIWHLSGITATSAPSPSQSNIRDMTNITAVSGELMGDLTGTDIVLKLFCDDKVRVRNVRIWTGDASAVTDYGA